MHRFFLRKTCKQVSRRCFSSAVSAKSNDLRELTKNNSHFDVIVIGAGIAGAAAALGATTPALAKSVQKSNVVKNSNPMFNLNESSGLRVLVIEGEKDFCYHTTGRSAAIFSEVYGTPSSQVLSTATKPFLYHPQEMGLNVSNGGDLVTKRPILWLATEESREEMMTQYNHTRKLVTNLELLNPTQIAKRSPWSIKNSNLPPSDEVLKEYESEREANEAMGIFPPAPVVGGIWEPDGADMDVDRIWRTMVDQSKRNGAVYLSGTRAGSAVRRGGRWEVDVEQELGGRSANCRETVSVTGDLVVNGGGAWADEVASMCGVDPLNFIPKKRTIILFDPLQTNPSFTFPPSDDKSVSGIRDTEAYLSAQASWPSVFCLNGRYYYKPDAGRILASPEDETPVLPHDASPDDEDIALCAHRLDTFSNLQPKSLSGSWAGLRVFAPDNNFVIGFESFFGDEKGKTSLLSSTKTQLPSDYLWLAGLGGFGIQTSFGNARVISSLIHRGGRVPEDLENDGLNLADLSPERFR